MNDTFDTLGKVRPQITYRFWASPGQGQSLDTLADQLEAAGNEVLGIDEENQRVLVGERSLAADRYGCRFCLDSGAIVIVDTEGELETHAREVHGWKG